MVKLKIVLDPSEIAALDDSKKKLEEMIKSVKFDISRHDTHAGNPERIVRYTQDMKVISGLKKIDLLEEDSCDQLGIINNALGEAITGTYLSGVEYELWKSDPRRKGISGLRGKLGSVWDKMCYRPDKR